MIRNLSIVSPVLPDAGVLTIYSVCAAEGGTAILTSERDAEDHVEVISIARLPAGLDPAAAWLRAAIPDFLALDRKTQVVVDAAGLGQSLFDHLQVAHRRSWVLFSKRGRDRQELVNTLLVAEQEKRIRIRPSPHADAMRKALLSYRRVIGEDGVIGGELVIALALAVTGRRRMGPPRVW
jgi:hypothetical protein